MSISSRNIFNYDFMLTKKRQLDVREVRIRAKERDLLSQALTQRSTEDDSKTRLVRAQRFFELGFQEGFTRGQTGDTTMPDVAGLFSIFSETLVRGNVRARGGPMKKDETYLVGEEGPELVTADRDSVVIPNDKLNGLKNNVNKTRVAIQPVIQRQVTQVPVEIPVPTSNMSKNFNIKRMSVRDLPSNIARLIT
tara:strand:+ start:3418 stop:3999 length:582 start_codon:yes stop_codon:yes gene_type:complete